MLDKIYDPSIDFVDMVYNMYMYAKIYRRTDQFNQVFEVKQFISYAPKVARGDPASPILPLLPYSYGHNKQLLLRQGDF